MGIEIPGIHHVTAITGDASGNATFYTQTLGLRLVKKTVNQDDVGAYHLFYGDETGSPGTELTFFDWPHSSTNLPGAATIGPVALRVGSVRALEWWAARFDELGVARQEIEDRRGRAALRFTDPEGQRLELVEDGEQPGGRPWRVVPAEFTIKGFHGVTITSAHPESTLAFLTRVLGFQQVDAFDLPGDSGSVTVFEVGPGGPGTEVRVLTPPEGGLGFPGIGGVHHVALRTPDIEQQQEWQERLARTGIGVTPLIDRYYFSSMYFREPGGALFEIATDGPGFTTDEPETELGQRLSLPPSLEPQRARIEADLQPITIGLPARSG